MVGVFAVEYWVGIVEKFVEFRFFFIISNQANRKVFYIFSAEYLWILYTFSAEYWGRDYIFSAECAGVWGCEF